MPASGSRTRTPLAAMKRAARALCALVVLAVLAVAALLIFGTAPPPPPIASITAAFSTMDLSTLPTIERYRARDGANLSFRSYPADDRQVAVLIHGSAGSSADMHLAARALQGARVSVVVPDLRGHGANLPHGDIAYLGQLEDDIEDLVRVLQSRYPRATRTLVGFSSGGGFALRIAAHPSLGTQFGGYVLLAPYLRYDSPAVRSHAAEEARERAGYDPAAKQGTWTSANVGRIIGLTLLNRFGVHSFNGLAVLSFAVPPTEPSVTATYSWRLQQNFGPHDDYLADMRAASGSMHVLVGAEDELLLPDQMRKIFHSQRPDVLVDVLPGLGHSAMVNKQTALAALVEACLSRGARSASRGRRRPPAAVPAGRRPGASR